MPPPSLVYVPQCASIEQQERLLGVYWATRVQHVEM